MYFSTYFILSLYVYNSGIDNSVICFLKNNSESNDLKIIEPFFFEEINLPIIEGFSTNKYSININFSCDNLNITGLSNEMSDLFISICKNYKKKFINKPIYSICESENESDDEIEIVRSKRDMETEFLQWFFLYNLENKQEKLGQAVFKLRDETMDNQKKLAKNSTLFNSMIIRLRDELKFNYYDKFSSLKNQLKSDQFVPLLFDIFNISDSKINEIKYQRFSKFEKCVYDLNKVTFELLEPVIDKFKSLVKIQVFKIMKNNNCVSYMKFKNVNEDVFIFDKKFLNYCPLSTESSKLISSDVPIINHCMNYYSIKKLKNYSVDECSTNNAIDLIKIFKTKNTYKIYCYPFFLSIDNREITNCPENVFEISIYHNIIIDYSLNKIHLYYLTENSNSNSIKDSYVNLNDGINEKIMSLQIEVDKDPELTKDIEELKNEKSILKKLVTAFEIMWSEFKNLLIIILCIILLISLSLILCCCICFRTQIKSCLNFIFRGISILLGLIRYVFNKFRKINEKKNEPSAPKSDQISVNAESASVQPLDTLNNDKTVYNKKKNKFAASAPKLDEIKVISEQAPVDALNAFN